jgi:hypothetical protein
MRVTLPPLDKYIIFQLAQRYSIFSIIGLKCAWPHKGPPTVSQDTSKAMKKPHNNFFFFLISNIKLYKKCEAPLSTQELYKRNTKKKKTTTHKSPKQQPPPPPLKPTKLQEDTTDNPSQTSKCYQSPLAFATARAFIINGTFQVPYQGLTRDPVTDSHDLHKKSLTKGQSPSHVAQSRAPLRAEPHADQGPPSAPLRTHPTQKTRIEEKKQRQPQTCKVASTSVRGGHCIKTDASPSNRYTQRRRKMLKGS